MAKNFLKSVKAGFLAGAKILAFVLISTSIAHAQPGSLDVTFNPGSGAGGSSPYIYCMALQTNGQIIIGGGFTTFNGVNRTRLARLNTNGSLDTSFDPGVGPDGSVLALALQPDGKILIGGVFGSLNNVPWNRFARLRPDGSVDMSFDESYAHYGSVSGGTVYALAVQADGKVIVGGDFLKVSGTNWNYIARLNTNSTLDVSFNPSNGVDNPARALGLQSSGQIIVGGDFTSINGTPRNNLARFNSGGDVDTSFDALIASGRVSVLVVTPEDKIVIGGPFTSINGYSRNFIARLNSDGSVDTTFNPGLGLNNYPNALALQADGKVIVGGGFSQFNGVNLPGLVRLNTNGTMDVSFNPGTGPSAGRTVYAIASQPDGKTLIGGSFYSFNGTNINGIARLNSDTSSTTLNLLNAQIYFGTYLQGTVSNTYRIEYTSDLNTPSLWTPLFNVNLQTNPQFILDPNPAGGQRFYRAVTLP
jgi:uncharacterized delta-60 repeat protein